MFTNSLSLSFSGQNNQDDILPNLTNTNSPLNLSLLHLWNNNSPLWFKYHYSLLIFILSHWMLLSLDFWSLVFPKAWSEADLFFSLNISCQLSSLHHLPNYFLWAPGKYGHLTVSYTPQTSEPPLFYASPAIPKPINISNLSSGSSYKSSQLLKQKSWVFLSFPFSDSSHRMFHLSHQHDWNGLPVVSAWAHDNPFSASICRTIFKTFNFEIMADLQETANTV